jgi:hypothetical protein
VVSLELVGPLVNPLLVTLPVVTLLASTQVLLLTV